MIYASDMNGGLIFLIVVLGFAAIGGISFLIYFLLKKSKPKEKKPDEKQAAEETLNMYLEDVKDPETIKELNENAKKAQENEKDGK